MQRHSVRFDPIPNTRPEVPTTDQVHVVLEEALQLMFELCVLKQACTRGQVNQQAHVTGLRRLITGHGAEHRNVGSAVALGDHLQLWCEGLEF